MVGSLIETRRGSYFWLSLLLYDLAPSHASHPLGTVPPLRETPFTSDFLFTWFLCCFHRDPCLSKRKKKFVTKVTFVFYKGKKGDKSEKWFPYYLLLEYKSSNLSWMDNYDDDEVSLDAVNIVVANIRMHSRFVIYIMILWLLYILHILHIIRGKKLKVFNFFKVTNSFFLFF